ncbi:type I restriction-modification system subunit M [Lactococcus ileimucosae]|uniref:type I restriction-modification system subunit M n=1 Tax=Lactococcus ileimucosae TaxID=2941329 RepID=UPI0035159F31
MSTTLNNFLWASANILRGKMDTIKCRNYLLGFIFYKYLSDLELHEVYAREKDTVPVFSGRKKQLEILDKLNEEDRRKLEEAMCLKHGYFIKPRHLFYSICQRAKDYNFKLFELQEAFKDLEKQGEQFKGLFADIDLEAAKRSADEQQFQEMIVNFIQALDEIDFFEYSRDAIEGAYEHLIGQFAAEAGRKVSEFYTPKSVSRVISEIVSIRQENKVPFHVYDPTMGSGSLMLSIRYFIHDREKIYYHGQELNSTTYNLARMNFILHGVDRGRMYLKNVGTLDSNWSSEVSGQFDAVVMNPPYSAKWSADEKFLEDARFTPYKKLAPKSKADFAFLLHGFYHLKETGTMGIILPHGVLFRGGAERIIRKTLLEKGAIDAIIGLPANILYATSIPTVIIILKKNRDTSDILFIDASNEFEKQKNQNKLRARDIEKIITTYKKRENVKKYAYLANFKEIKSNDFNLNISRYVHTFEEEEPIDIVKLSKEIAELNQKISNMEQEQQTMLEQLASISGSSEIMAATNQIFGE